MNSSCPTCLDIFTQSCHILSTPCGHFFHQNCIESWLINEHSCPQCRQECQQSKLRQIYFLNSSCPTCLESFSQSCHIFSTPCGHIFHKNCILRWLEGQASCPQCRQRCQQNTLQRIYLNDGKDQNWPQN